MNCDSAFDLMTDGDGSRSLALARHLEDCPRCRQMQDTLAPALEFLAADVGDDVRAESAAPFTSSGDVSRQPFVTTETLQIAHQAATWLRFQTRPTGARWQRIAARSLQYAAVFAAGLLLAFTLFESRRRAAPGADQCTRHEAARSDAQRSEAEIRTVVLSCAACHEKAPDTPSLPADRSSSLNKRHPDADDWLRQLFTDETLIAGVEAQEAAAPHLS